MFQTFYKHAVLPWKDQIIQTIDDPITKKKLLPFISKQFARKDMILDLDWLGSKHGVYHEAGFGTDMGLCEWITPNVTANFTKLKDLEPGSTAGLNNGLTLLLDTESFDYGVELQ